MFCDACSEYVLRRGSEYVLRRAARRRGSECVLRSNYGSRLVRILGTKLTQDFRYLFIKFSTATV